MVEQAVRVVQPALHDVGIGQPEAARQERALIARQPVVAVLRGIAQQQAVAQQLTFNGLHGARHARIVRRQEPHLRNQQQAGVQRRAAVVLHKGIAFCVVAVSTDVVADLVGKRAPALHRPFQAEALAGLHGAVQRHPAHQPGMRERAGRPTHFPDAVIGLPP
ncbi:hypothetical protein D3C71_1440120 [compost metagenome]